MIPTVLGLCLPWLITLTILTRQTFIKLRSLQRLLVLLFREQEPPLHHQFHQEGKQECLGHCCMEWLWGEPGAGRTPCDSTAAAPAISGTEEIALLPARRIVLPLQNALCSNGSLQLGFPLPETCCRVHCWCWNLGWCAGILLGIYSLHPQEILAGKSPICLWLCNS